MPRGQHPNSRKNLTSEAAKAHRFKPGENGAKDPDFRAKLSEGRKRSYDMAAIAKKIAAAAPSESARKALEGIGVDDETMTNSALVVAGIFKQAAQGRMDAVEKWERLTASLADDERPFYIPARLLGRAFVDIDRRIEAGHTYTFEGGRGGLKSSYVALKVVELLKNNRNIHACVVRKIGNTISSSVFPQIQRAIEWLGLEDEFTATKSPYEIKHVKTGQTIYFRGVDDPGKLKSITTPFGYIGVLWIEEEDQIAGEAEERNIKQSVLRGGDNTYFFTSYNPPKTKDSWVNIRRRVNDDPKRHYLSVSYLDAPAEWLGQTFIDDAEHLKAVNPDAYEHEYLGVANGNGGNVFENLELREITDSEIGSFDRIYQGVDWGWYPDPFAFIRCHYDAARETIFIVDEIVENKLNNETSADKIKAKGYADYHIYCDSAEPKSVADFRACGLPAQAAIKGPGSVDYSMKWLQGRKIVIDRRRTPRAYDEFVNYEYERTKDGEILSGYPDRDNHTIDALRYALERVYKRFGSNA